MITFKTTSVVFHTMTKSGTGSPPRIWNLGHYNIYSQGSKCVHLLPTVASSCFYFIKTRSRGRAPYTGTDLKGLVQASLQRPSTPVPEHGVLVSFIICHPLQQRPEALFLPGTLRMRRRLWRYGSSYHRSRAD